jgi:hypothetical protein
MSALPDVIRALVSGGLGLFSVPGSSAAGETVKKVLRGRSETAAAILFDELRGVLKIYHQNQIEGTLRQLQSFFSFCECVGPLDAAGAGD